MSRLALCLLLLAGGCLGPGPVVVHSQYHLGDTAVQSVLHDRGAGLFFFNMHDDEDTAVEAGLTFIEQRGGGLLTLEHSGRRRIHFSIEEREFSIDPNRIFTPVGVRKTLEPFPAEEAVRRVERFGEDLLREHRVTERGEIITLHNNSEDRYSAESYLPGGEYAADADEVFLVEGRDRDDFFFVTTRSLFEQLAEAGFNVVLQNNRTVTDDGSLSVLAAELGIPYVNVEAQHGHLEEQIEMLEALRTILLQR